MTPFDLRWLVAAAAILVGGFMKGISGMGLPLVATPVIAALYDLPTAITVTMPATILSDLPILYTFRGESRHARRLAPVLVPLALGAVVGIWMGTSLLVRLSENLLRMVLGVLVLLFVVVTYYRLIPHLSEKAAARIGPIVGLGGGILQGAAGQSGPIISSYMYQLGLPRATFLFVINAFFLVADVSQVLSLMSRGLYTPARWQMAGVAALLSMPTLLVGLRVQKHLSEERFRRVVLAVLALTGLVLVIRGLLA